jgi:LAO/AO transport system kinase
MQEHALDPGVFIRSMASRGHLGGLSLATREAIRALDAAGLPWVLVETVGVGQTEMEIAHAADTTVVVLNPGWGDSVQANKAGLLEVADVFVINKADRPGAKETERDLERMLDMSPTTDWRPPIVPAIATTGQGAADVWETIGRHRRHLEESGGLSARRQRRLDEELRQIVVRRLERDAYARCGGAEFERLLNQLAERRIDPYTAAEALVGGE